jgi:ATP-dependent Lhr-like helicase
LRSSPISLYVRENLPHWLALATENVGTDHSADAMRTLGMLARAGALFFDEIVRQTGLPPSRVERALAELAAQGIVTADSFEGLRALLLPDDRRASLGPVRRPRRRRTVTSVEFAGRWSLLRAPAAGGVPDASGNGGDRLRDGAVEAFARAFLRRYGVVFRRVLERETIGISWFELVRVYRRLEARGEIRGGHFVGGASGEQFALPDAIGMLRRIRRSEASGELVTISAADPLNLAGILTPGPRIPAVAPHRLLLRDGVPVAALKAGEIVMLAPGGTEGGIDRALRVGRLSPRLRPYYAR